MDERLVAEVTAELRGHLGVLMPVCRELLERTADPERAEARKQLHGALIGAEVRLGRGPGEGSLQALIHMRLLGEDVAFFARVVLEDER